MNRWIDAYQLMAHLTKQGENPCLYFIVMTWFLTSDWTGLFNRERFDDQFVKTKIPDLFRNNELCLDWFSHHPILKTLVMT